VLVVGIPCVGWGRVGKGVCCLILFRDLSVGGGGLFESVCELNLAKKKEYWGGYMFVGECSRVCTNNKEKTALQVHLLLTSSYR
jgi:hypothetical protein